MYFSHLGTRSQHCYVLGGLLLHDMTCSQVAVKGDGVQTWRVAANMAISSRKQLTRYGPPAMGSDEGLTNPHLKQ